MSLQNNPIVLIFIGIIIALLLNWVKTKIFKQGKKIIINSLPEEEKQKLIELYHKGLIELRALTKNGIILPKDPSNKNIVQTVSSDLGRLGKWISSYIRLIPIFFIIGGVVYGVGYWRGQGNKPILVNLEGSNVPEQGYMIKLDGNYMHITKKGEVHIQASPDPNSKEIIKVISVKDIPEVYKKIRPYGFVIEPIVVGGYGVGEKGSFEGGAGLSWAKLYKWRLQSIITSGGVYPLAVGYHITNNSGIGGSVGKGWKGDTRGLVYWFFKF